MTDAPIRAALRAATRAMNGRMADRGYGVPWPEYSATIAAAAVAEFLKQMDSVPLGNGFTFAALAAAIARAAEGEG